MDIVINCGLIVLFLCFLELVSYAAKHGVFSRWRLQARLRLGRRIPPGSYRIEGEIGISFGHDDATLLLTLPLQDRGASKPTRYVGATDESTRFTVNHLDVEPDTLLEAYDDSLGPIQIQVFEPGRIAEIDISKVSSG